MADDPALKALTGERPEAERPTEEQLNVDIQRKLSEARQNRSGKNLEIEFVNWLDPRTIRDTKAIFRGPEHPWHYAWVRDTAEANKLETHLEYKLELASMGFREADFRALYELFVFGRDALVLGCPRDKMSLRTFATKAVPQAPPPTPTFKDWKKRAGLVIPPTVDNNGHAWVGPYKLYQVERELMDEQYAYWRKQANASDWHVSGDLIKEGRREKGFEIELDDYLPSQTSGI